MCVCVCVCVCMTHWAELRQAEIGREASEVEAAEFAGHEKQRDALADDGGARADYGVLGGCHG